MKTRKVQIDRPAISSEQIAKKRNFEEVLQGAQNISTPFYKQTWFIINTTITTAVILAFVLFYSSGEIESDTPSWFVSPALDRIDIPYEVFEVNATQEQMITSETGSQIRIPAHAFVDADGLPIEGNVQILYREMHTPEDFFVAGIKMEYDSAGVQYNLESAGMIDIRGIKHGTDIFIAPNKAISIDLVSNRAGTHYNLYYLDTVQQNWVFEGKDSVSVRATEQESELTLSEAEEEHISHIDTQIQHVRQEIATIEKQKPVEPKNSAEFKWTFDIDANLNDFPELSSYKKTIWAVDETEKAFDPETGKIVWYDVIIEKGRRKDVYTITFSRPNQTVSYDAVPAFKGNNYMEAKRVYDSKFALYSQQLENRRQAEKELQERRQRWLEQEQQRRIEMERARVQRLNTRESSITNQNIIRSFRIGNFGIWNCDVPIPITDKKEKRVSFVDDQGNSLSMRSVFIINKRINSLYYFNNRGGFYNLSYDYTAQNMILGVTLDNRIGIVSYNDFISVVEKNKSSEIPLSFLDVTIQSPEDVKKLFESYFSVNFNTDEIEEELLPEELTIRAYPNPFSSSITVAANRENQYRVEIVNMQGSIVLQTDFSGQEVQLNTQDVSPGNYIIRLIENSFRNTVTTRAVKSS